MAPTKQALQEFILRRSFYCRSMVDQSGSASYFELGNYLHTIKWIELNSDLNSQPMSQDERENQHQKYNRRINRRKLIGVRFPSQSDRPVCCWFVCLLDALRKLVRIIQFQGHQLVCHSPQVALSSCNNKITPIKQNSTASSPRFASETREQESRSSNLEQVCECLKCSRRSHESA